MASELFSQWRLDPDIIHLNHGSFGAAPRRVLAEQQRLRDLLEANPDAFILELYQPALDRARQSLAKFIGADLAGLVFVDNATTGVNAVLRSLEPMLQPGDEVVVTDHTYNACRNAAVVSAERRGATVVTARVPFPIDGPDTFRDAVLSAVTERTRILIVDAITSPTALVVPVHELVAELEPDVHVLVDAAHAGGMIDLDIEALGASYVTGNCHKWMCAPKGAAFLSVRADRRDVIYHSVISHGYNAGWPSSGGHLHRQFDWTGTDDPTAWLAVPAAIETIADMHPDGWAGIRRRNRDLCLAGRSIMLDALGLEAPAPEEMIGSIASFSIPDPSEPSDDIFDPLMGVLRHKWSIEAPVFAWPERPHRLLRISAHLYNSVDEYDRLAKALTAEFGL